MLGYVVYVFDAIKIMLNTFWELYKKSFDILKNVIFFQLLTI